MKKIAMIGCGKLGLDCAEVMAEHYDVIGYDVEPKTPLNFLMANSIQEAVIGRDLIFIAAPTPHDPMYGGEAPTSHLPNKDFDYSIVIEILKEVNKYVNRNQLVVLISTVLPGTTRTILFDYITNSRFIYNPYLIAMGTVKWDMVNPEMVIIGTNNGDTNGDALELIEFYKPIIQNNPRYEVGTWDEAEAIKIFYNTFISTKLALVNMIQDVAETSTNINVDVVTNALAKSTHRIMGPAYMKAGLGDAGACHPRDNIALRYLAEKLDLGYDLFDSIMTAREVQAERMAKRCLELGSNITIIGKAYKPSVPYLNGSASILIGHYIEKHGGKLNYYDENTGDLNLRQDWTDIYLIGYWESWVEKIQFPAHAIVIDPWRRIDKNQFSGEIIHYGNTRVVHRRLEQIEEAYHQSVKKLIETFPYLNNTVETMHVIPISSTGVDPFIIKPTQLIFNEIKANHDRGKDKFFFEALNEPINEDVILKITRILRLLKPYTRFSEFIYVTNDPNAKQIYADISKKYNIPPTSILIIVENVVDKGNEYFTELKMRKYRLLSEIDYKTNEVNPEDTGIPPTKVLEYPGGKTVVIPVTWITEEMRVEQELSLTNGNRISFPNYIAVNKPNFELNHFANHIKEHVQTPIKNALQWCCGTGVDGFELLIQNICEHVTFVDISEDAISAVLSNARNLNLSDRVTGVVAPMIYNLPINTKFDLVIGTPPRASMFPTIFDYSRHLQFHTTASMEEIANTARIEVDHKLVIRKEFFKNIGSYLTTDANIFLLEYAAHRECVEWSNEFGLKYLNSYLIYENPPMWLMHYKLF